MGYNILGGFPRQRLSFSKKTKKWRSDCVNYGDNHSLRYNRNTRMSVQAMETNYDLLNGKIHMNDLKLLVNPYNIEASFIPDNIQHYPVINSKLQVLRGEESKRLFDFRVVVTNIDAISEIEEEKNKQVNLKLQQLLADNSQSEEEFNNELEKLSDYFQYEYQDKREIRANRLINHYIKELELPQLFNLGFVDVEAVAEEAYQVDIVGGEPTVSKLDPRKIRIIRSGYSNKIEDADMIILEDYWSPGKVIDTFWDQLSSKDIDEIEKGLSAGSEGFADEMGNLDPRYAFVPALGHNWVAGEHIDVNSLFDDTYHNSLLPYDLNGNVRVLRVYWKSYRKIKKVKSYDYETGEEIFNFYPESYVCREDLGEEEQVFWINEAWEGTKIGNDIFVNMKPRPVQYNRLSNPSRCHFGIIGSIYNLNGDTPFSLVDMMKPYAYLYDIVHDRLNKILARNKGRIARMDFAKVPKGWQVDQWLYYMEVNGIAVEDSFKAADEGPATGKIAGVLNNANNGVIDLSLGNEIQQYISLLEWIVNKIGSIAGISPQREGQVSNRETVGGVERATLQSSHITEWLFFIHESVKQRVLECLLETSKIALKGRKKKFEYILSDGSKQIMEIDGDEFAECDYGLIMDNSNDVQSLIQNANIWSQAALQTQSADLSAVMKTYLTKSPSEKIRILELSEKRKLAQQQQQQQQQMQLQQQQLEQQTQLEQQKQQMEYQMHVEDNETKIQVALINGRAEELRMSILNGDNAEANDIEREKMAEEARQFSEKLKLEKKKHEDDVRLKEKQINNSRK